MGEWNYESSKYYLREWNYGRSAKPVLWEKQGTMGENGIMGKVEIYVREWDY